ncbi:MAG: protein TonB [Crocinitomix sp.]|jgi:protein TonB
MKFIFILLLLPIFSFAQEKSEEKVYDFVEVDPVYPGGTDAMVQYIQQNVEYPKMSREMGDQGIVYVKFIVAKDGAIKDVRIRKGVSAALDAEAMRVISSMPNWIPGKQAGKAVSVNFTLPIHFRLGSNKEERRAKKAAKKLKKTQNKAAKQEKG